MTIAQMQYFQAVCRCGSVSKAAEALHISQPSVSISIKDLENEFKVMLFRRENKQLLLTQEGVYFCERINDILGQINALALQMSDMGRSNNRINLGIPNIAGMVLFSLLVDDFSDQNPHINFEVKQCGMEAAIKKLEDGSCDLAIVVDNGKIPSRFEKIQVLSSEFVYCVAPNHPFAGREKVGLAELCDEPLILNQDDSFLTVEIKRRFFKLGLVPNVLLYAVQMPLIKELLSTGKAGTFLSNELAQTLPDILAIPLEEPIALTFVMIWKKDKHIGRDVSAFMEHVKHRCPEGMIS